MCVYGVWGCGCLKDHTCLALVGMVCHGHSPGWPCLGSCHLPARVCVQGPSP